MSSTKRYFGYLENKLEEMANTEEKNIKEAAKLVTESILNNGRFYVFGSGHSHMIAEEIYLRAGGIALVHAILLPELMLHEMPRKSTYIERMDGYAFAMLDLHEFDSNDTLMVVSNSGRNNVPVEMALAAKDIGGKVIAMTSVAHSSKVASRHKSGKKIMEIADVTLDNHAPFGDAEFYVGNIKSPVGPVSDFTGIALAQALIVTVVEYLDDNNFEIPIFKSANLDGTSIGNQELFDKYYGYWK